MKEKQGDLAEEKPDYRVHVHSITDYNWSSCFTMMIVVLIKEPAWKSNLPSGYIFNAYMVCRYIEKTPTEEVIPVGVSI